MITLRTKINIQEQTTDLARKVKIALRMKIIINSYTVYLACKDHIKYNVKFSGVKSDEKFMKNKTIFCFAT